MRVVVNPDRPARLPIDRRTIALLAFVLAAVSIIAIPGLVGRRTDGTPVAGEVPGPPQPGLCLGPAATREQLLSPGLSVPTVPCTQPHSAEIVLMGSLDSDEYPAVWTTPDPVFDPIWSRCTDMVTRYVSGVRSRGPDGRLGPRSRARVVLPSSVQWAYGQRWYACAVLPATDSYPISWNGTAHLAGLQTPPAPFATCANGVGGQPVDCREPHGAEQLTWTNKPKDGPSGCYALASAIIGVDDPSFRGALAVAERRVHPNTQCWVMATGGAQLTGTLIGHGAGPLPLG